MFEAYLHEPYALIIVAAVLILIFIGPLIAKFCIPRRQTQATLKDVKYIIPPWSLWPFRRHRYLSTGDDVLEIVLYSYGKPPDDVVLQSLTDRIKNDQRLSLLKSWTIKVQAYDLPCRYFESGNDGSHPRTPNTTVNVHLECIRYKGCLKNNKENIKENIKDIIFKHFRENNVCVTLPQKNFKFIDLPEELPQQ